MQSINLGGEFSLAAYDRPRGSRRRRKLWEQTLRNGVTTPGLADLLSVAFAAGTQKPAWYVGLIDNASFSAVSSSDTSASHAGWVELTGYTAGARPQWSPTVTNALAVNATPLEFVPSGSIAVKGLFVASVSTKGGTTGILWSTAVLAAVRNLAAGQALEVIYRLRAGGGGS